MITYPRTIDDNAPFPVIPLRTRATANQAIPNPFGGLIATVPLVGRVGNRAILRPPLAGVCGVTELAVFCGGVKSRSFHDGDGGNDGNGDPTPFPGAPGVDDLWVGWHITDDHLLRSATFELFSALAPNAPVATTVLTRKKHRPIPELRRHPNIRHNFTGSMSLAALFTLPANHHLGTNPDAFASGVPTAECGPYRIKLTLRMRSASSEALWPDIAWTHFDVLVAALELMWCPDGKVTDILPFATLARDGGVYAKLKDLTDGTNLAGAFPAANQEKRVYLDSPTFTLTPAEMEDNTFYNRYRAMWGDGPNVPIFVRVLVRSAGGGAVFAPEAVGKAKIAWDWEDHGAVGNSPNPAVNNWVQSTMSGPVVPAVDAPAPVGAGANCLLARGGKRGTGARTCFPTQPGKPPTPVLPAHGGTNQEFPFKVDPNDGGGSPTPTWKWSAFSETWPTGEFAGMSGVMFQPSIAAGDGYALRAFYCAATDANMKGEVDAGYPAQLSTSSGVFRVFRYASVQRVTMYGGPNAPPMLNLPGVITRWEGHFVHLRFNGVNLNWSGYWFTEYVQAVGGASVVGMRPALPAWLRAAFDDTGTAHLVTLRPYAQWRTAMETMHGSEAAAFNFFDNAPTRNDALGVPVPKWWFNSGNSTPFGRPWAVTYNPVVQPQPVAGQVDVTLDVTVGGNLLTRAFHVNFAMPLLGDRKTSLSAGARQTIDQEVRALLGQIAGNLWLPAYDPNVHTPINVTYASETNNHRRTTRMQNIGAEIERVIADEARRVSERAYINNAEYAWAFETLDVVLDLIAQAHPLPAGLTVLQLANHISTNNGPIGKSFNSRAGGAAATPGTLANVPLIETLEHEIGHSMFLNHHFSPAAPNDPRRLHQPTASLGGRFCMMYYMPATLPGHCEFCGICTLRLRGWSLHTTDAAGVPNPVSRALWYDANYNNGTHAGVPPDPVVNPANAMVV